MSNLIHHFRDDLPSQSLVWCTKLVFLTSHLTGAQKLSSWPITWLVHKTSLPDQSLDWCTKMVFLTNHLACSSKTNITATKWQHKQEVWLLGSADTVSPHPSLMTQYSKHYVSRFKKRQRWDVQSMWAYDLDLWPWRSPRLSVVLCQSTTCKFWWYYDHSFSIYEPLGQHSSNWSCDLATLPFDLGGHGACSWCGSSSSICIPSLKFICLAIRKIWCTMCQH